MTTIINVTKEDIERGRRMDTETCPIALALRRRFPKMEIRVWHDMLEINGIYYEPTDRMSNFVCDFDNGIPVKPFYFDLAKLIIETPILM